MDLEKIQAIICPQRVGKTSAMQLAIKELKTTRGISPRQIIYFNSEDERVQFAPHQLDLILQAWQELNPDTKLGNAWFFFDEVQVAPGLERFLNRISSLLHPRLNLYCGPQHSYRIIASFFQRIL